MQDHDIQYHIPIPNINYNPPLYACRLNTKPFSLDGNIDKDFWADIPYTSDFTDISGYDYPAPRYRTRAKMCWDRDNFYIAALLEGDEIWATVTQRDEIIFVDNDFEIFIDTGSDTQPYYEFEMNALNTVWDLLLTKPYRDSGNPHNSWDIKGLKSAVYIDGVLNEPGPHNHSWSVEVVFPFTSFMETAQGKLRPAPGEYWRVNYSRVQWKVDIVNGTYTKRLGADGKPLPEDNWVWAPTGLVNIHYPELWGFVFFVESSMSSPPSIPDIEMRKWALRTLYYQEHRYYDEHGYFTTKLDMLPSFPVVIEITGHSFEISCRTVDDKGTLYILADGKTTYISDEDE